MQSRLIQDRWVFRDDYDAEILHRDTELEHLSRRLRPALHGLETDDALIYGPSGVGKTTSGRYLIRQLNQKRSIQSATIECASKSCHGVIYEAINRHRSGTAVTPNAPTRELIETLEAIVDEPYVLILDEADTIPGLGCLDDLLNVPGVSAVAITHDNEEWLARLPGDLAERFRGDGEIEYDRYDDSELVDILEPRVDKGLSPGVASAADLEYIARDAEGTGRLAIRGLLAAAESAEVNGHDSLQDDDLEGCIDEAKRKVREDNLESLPPVYQAIYELVRGYGPGGVVTTELKKIYYEERDVVFANSPRDPVEWKRARDHLGKLSDYDLISITGNTSGQRYTATDEDLVAPIDVRFGKQRL